MKTPKTLMTDIMVRLETEHKALSRDINESPLRKVIMLGESRSIKIDGKEFLIEVSEIR